MRGQTAVGGSTCAQQSTAMMFPTQTSPFLGLSRTPRTGPHLPAHPATCPTLPPRSLRGATLFVWGFPNHQAWSHGGAFARARALPSFTSNVPCHIRCPLLSEASLVRPTHCPIASLRFLSCILLLPGVFLFICLVACLPAARTYSTWEQEPHGTVYCCVPGAWHKPARRRSPARLSE